MTVKHSGNLIKKNKSKSFNIIDKLILFFCGFFAFSPMVTYLSIDVFNFPLALPELFFFPFYFKLRKVFDLSVDFKVLLFGLFIMLFLFAISLLQGLFPLGSILSTMRGYFYLLLVFSIFKNKPISNIDYVFYIALGSSIAWGVLGLMSFNKVVYSIHSDESIIVYGNMISLALMIAISIIFNKKFMKYVVLAITIIISIFVGLRRQMAVAFVSYIVSFFLQLRLSFKRIFNLSITIIILVSTIIFLYPIAESFIAEHSYILHRRVFVRSEALVKGNLDSGDHTRSNSIISFLDNLDDYILPKGFVSKRTGVDKDTGIFVDSPFIEMFHTIGLLLSIPLVFWFFRLILFHFKNYYSNNITESGICIVLGGVVLLLMFVEGTFLNFPYITPFTGYVFARIFSKKNLTR